TRKSARRKGVSGIEVRPPVSLEKAWGVQSRLCRSAPSGYETAKAAFAVALRHGRAPWRMMMRLSKPVLPTAPARLLVAGLAMALLVSGCTQLKGRQGYVADSV